MSSSLKQGTGTLYKGIIEGEFFKYADVRYRGALGEAEFLKYKGSILKPGNYEGIDLLGNMGTTGTQFKVLSLSTKTAGIPEKFEQYLGRYVDKLKNFEGYAGKMTNLETGIVETVDSSFIQQRQLALLVGRTTPTPQQLRVFNDVARQAARGPRPVSLHLYAGQ